MSLPTPEEFTRKIIYAPWGADPILMELRHHYAAAYELAETQAKRIAELEADLSRAKSLNGMHMKRAIDAGGERDAALTSLAELRERIASWIKPDREGRRIVFEPREIEELAVATPGRGEKLMAEREAFKDALLEALRYNVANIGTKDAFYVCSTPPKGVLPKWVNNALAALADLDADGAE